MSLTPAQVVEQLLNTAAHDFGEAATTQAAKAWLAKRERPTQPELGETKPAAPQGDHT